MFSLKDILDQVTVHKLEKMAIVMYKLQNLQEQVMVHKLLKTGPRSAVGNVSGYRCVSDCRSRGREFDPGPVPYFRGD